MLGFAETLGAILGSLLIPAFIGLVIVSGLARFLKPRYLAALAIGIYLWYFSDTIGDASYLGVNEGFSGGIFHLVLWLLFGVGLVLLFGLDRELLTPGPNGYSFGFAIPVLVALAVGMHGFGEGAAIGATAASTPSTDLLEAFGGLTSAVAFLLHKGLEPMMVGAAYWIYARNHAKTRGEQSIDLILLAIVFSIPAIIGGASAYYIVDVFPSADFTYAFAFGLGTSIYALVRLARPLFEAAVSKYDAVTTALLILIGFTLLYFAAIFHS